MRRVYVQSEPNRVPDGTLLSEVLRVEGFSLAAGVIEPGMSSKIHLHPFVSQVTYLQSGRLMVWMRGPGDKKPYSLELLSNQACLTEPGTFFQLVNSAYEPCQVLYIVSPPFLFETGPTGNVVYNDAVVLDKGWEDLAGENYDLGKFVKHVPTAEERQKSADRLAIMHKSITRVLDH